MPHTPPALSPETEERLARSRLRWYRTAGITGIATCLLLSWGIATLLDNSEAAREQRAAQIALTRRVVECTTAPALRHPPVKPGDVAKDDCYRQQQQATSQFVGQPPAPINTNAVAAAACGAAHPGDFTATLACTRRALASLDKTP